MPSLKALEKYGFKLYALCIMSNHVRYLQEPKQAKDLSKIMHFLNWYMGFVLQSNAQSQGTLLGTEILRAMPS